MSKIVDLYDDDAIFEEMQETLVIDKGSKKEANDIKRSKYRGKGDTPEASEESEEDEGEEGEEGEKKKPKKTKRLSKK